MKFMKSILVITVLVMLVLTACDSDDGETSSKRRKKSKSDMQTVVVFTPLAWRSDYLSNDDIDILKETLEERLVNSEVYEYEFKTDYKNNEVTLILAKALDEELEALIKDLSETKLLSFREGDDFSAPIALTGADVKKSVYFFTPGQPQGDEMMPATHGVSLEFTEEGTQKFSDLTARLSTSWGVVSIWLDDVLLSSPQVSTHIRDGKAQITGKFTREEAMQLASDIKIGALPFDVEYTIQ